MHEPEPERIREEATRSDSRELARWENEGGACDERELISLSAQMATGEPMNEASSP